MWLSLQIFLILKLYPSLIKESTHHIYLCEIGMYLIMCLFKAVVFALWFFGLGLLTLFTISPGHISQHPVTHCCCAVNLVQYLWAFLVAAFKSHLMPNFGMDRASVFEYWCWAYYKLWLMCYLFHLSIYLYISVLQTTKCTKLLTERKCIVYRMFITRHRGTYIWTLKKAAPMFDLKDDSYIMQLYFLLVRLFYENVWATMDFCWKEG